VRNRGTIGGSLAHADPAADLPAVMLALAAQIIAVGPGGTRAIAAEDFFVGALTSGLASNEVITEIRVLLPPNRAGGAYSKHPHPASRFAVVGVAASVVLVDDANTVRDARVAVTGLGTYATLAAGAAQSLGGTQGDDAAIAAAAARVAEGIEPNADLQGDATYKLHLAKVHAARAIRAALRRAKGLA
jgi:carbon-monoxide dehydrogenase medium subunit